MYGSRIADSTFNDHMDQGEGDGEGDDKAY